MNEQLAILRIQVFEIINNTNQFATQLEKSDNERKKLQNEIIANLEQVHKNYEPHMQRHSSLLTEEKLSVKGSLMPVLGENPICAKDIPKLEEWPTLSGEGEYNHIELIRTIDMLQEHFHIPDEIIVGKLHSFFTRTAKKWYYKMRQDHGKHDWPWWKSEIITKWAKSSWRNPYGIQNGLKNSREDKRPERPFLKCHKCGRTSNLANTCTKKKKTNEAQVIEEVQCTEEKEESDLDYAVSEDTPVEDYPIENITAFFEVTEVHTHFPQYSEDCHNLINIKYSRMCKAKPARGKGYTAGASCITSILRNNIEARVNLDTGAFCTCVGKDYLQAIPPG
ncbi:hypothetical protein O181_069068 [Austropuccinia psidii MF-1]|uniref:Retrotransposon gag domain-containing protein n=1 Tax=Austropuccinia psidii MF-1 TaxID=1389203 RepID=A0A9Q3EWG5_9BASI|nr:hypothetical protein [Austropuccinia psidii MF-1]